MAKIYVTNRAGEETAITLRPTVTLMRAITDAGMADLLALCGGVCSCGTCHVYIDGDMSEALPPMQQDENDLLDCSDHRLVNSRLSCQIRLCNEIDGLRATIAPED